MRIAVASEGLEVSPHAGHCSGFMCYTVDRGVITECQNLPNPGLPGPALAEMFQEVGVDALVCGGIEMDMANALCHAGIDVVAGTAGSTRSVAEAYVNHTLIGAEELCHLLDETPDAGDEELESAFGRIERQLEAAAR